MPTLHWLTREQDLKASGLAPYRLLNHVETYGDPDTENMLIQGDNLDGLKALLPYYAGKVKCIYIDPPYNTRSAFEHYDDNMEHTQWLSMMYPRLELLRELLSEDGSIWVNLDDNEAHYLKVVMDEIFGRFNFQANCLWQKVYSERMDAKSFSTSHDHILVYSKSTAFHPNRIIKDQNISQFKFFDEKVSKYYRRRSLRKEGSESLRKDRPSMWYSIPAPDGSPVYPVKPDGTEGRWRWKKENTQNNQTLLDFVLKNGKWEIYVKQYLEENPTRPPATLWNNEEVGHNHEAKLEIQTIFAEEVFDTPKPERLIQRVIHIATNPGDLVLDSFLGSGTTAAVAHKMGRRYIGIEIGEHATTHCVPRLQKVIQGEQGGISTAVSWQGGGGVRFYRLGEPIFDDDGQIRKDIRFPQLAAHVWFSETKTPWQPPAEQTPFLGIHESTAYYLLYNGILKDKSVNGGNVLTSRILASLAEHDGPRVIYGERCLFSPARLKQLNITFKHTPYDIKGR